MTWYENNKDKYDKYVSENKEKIQERKHKDNPDYGREWRTDNPTPTYTCACGATILITSQRNHNLSKKHLRFLEINS